MPAFSKKYLSLFLRVLSRAVPALLVPVLLLNLWLIFIGWPSFALRWLEQKIAPPGTACHIVWMRGGLFSNFEIENFTLRADIASTEQQLKVEIPALTLSFNRLSLCAFRLRPNQIVLHNGTVSIQPQENLPSSHAGPKLRSYALESRITLSANQTLQGYLSLKFHGASLLGEIDLTHCDSLRKLRELAAYHIPDTPATAFPVPDDWYDRLISELDAITLGDADAVAKLAVTADLDHPDSLQMQGWFDMTSTIIHGVVVPKLRGAFSYSQQRLQFSEFQLLLSMQETVRAGATVDFQHNRINATASGDIFPRNLLSLCAVPRQLLPREIFFEAPVHFEGSLTDAPLDAPEQWSPALAFAFRQLFAYNLPLYNGEGRLRWNQGRLLLESLRLSLDYRNRETFTLHGVYDHKNKLLSGQADGQCKLRRILSNRYSIQHDMLIPEEQFEHFHATLFPSPADWRKLHIEGTLQRPRFALPPFHFQNLHLTLSLQDGVLAIPALTAQLYNAPEFSVRLAASLPLEQLLAPDGNCIIPVSLALAETEGPAAAPEEFPRNENAVAGLQAHLNLSTRHKSLAFEDCGGKVSPSPFAHFLTALFDSNDVFMNEAFNWTQGQVPLTFTVTMPPWHWNKPAAWELEGVIRSGEFDFMTVPFLCGEAQFRLNQEELRFSAVSGRLKNTLQPFSIEQLAIHFEPFQLTFGQISYCGTPELLEPFVYDPESREIYRQIWQNVTWSSASPPVFTVENLDYQDLPGARWRFTLDGTFSARNARYRDIVLPETSCRLALNLPGDGLILKDITIADTDTPPLRAEATVRFHPGIAGDFKAVMPEGNFDLLQLLGNAVPALAPSLSSLSLAADSHFECKGKFDSAADNPLSFEGTVETPHFSYRNVTVKDVLADLSLNGSTVSWKLKRGRLDGGEIFSGGQFRLDSQTGKCIITGRDIPLASLVALSDLAAPAAGDTLPSPASATTGDYPGLVDFNVNTDFFRNWALQPVLLDGYGHLELREADLWRIPLFTQLGRMLEAGSFHLFSSDKFAKLGSISKLNADIEFRGSRVEISQLVTNGTIIALYGSGCYDLSTGRVDGMINSELLSAVRFISWPLRPLAWAFEARLSGKVPNVGWKLQSTIRKLFSTKAIE